MEDDGVTITATTNGQVALLNGKIDVSTVFKVDGNVGIQTGNVSFVGNVLVTGDVEEGFSVKATGNIDVYGNVQGAEMEAGGNLTVRQGIIGRNDKRMVRARLIVAKFIENSFIAAGDKVLVSDGIINSQIDAKNSIICQGNRAKIIGGRLRASSTIVSKDIINNAIVEVGYDPESKAKLDDLVAKRLELEPDFENLKKDINTLVNLKKDMRDNFPAEKNEYLKELQQKHTDIAMQIKNYTAQIQDIQNYLNSLRETGRVSVSGQITTGVIVRIKDLQEPLRSDYNSVSFTMSEGKVKAGPFHEEDAKEANGTTNT
jgi:uncharacterized protein (DUF342 family)